MFMELSVIIPVYNESKIIRCNLEKVNSYLQTLGLEYEIIVVNDGSTDDILKQVSSMEKKHLSIISYAKNQGKGFAVNRGMTAARGRYRLFMDMDLSTDLTEIPKFLQYVQNDMCDICVGNRHAIRLLDQKRPWHRALLGKIFTILSSICIGYRLEDFTCGFKIFTAQACERILPHQRIYDWAFDSELIAIAHQLGLRIRQESVSWEHHNGSKVCILRAIPSSLLGLFLIWYRVTSKQYLIP